MLILVTGAAASGKSEIAETEAVKLHTSHSFTKGGLYYVACMHASHEEDKRRVERHRLLRQGKGFTTLEQYADVGDIVIGRNDTVLVECMSNLLANEMFDSDRLNHGKCDEPKMLSTKIISDITSISKRCADVVVVTNEVFSDGYRYDEECRCYLECLGQINIGLANMADLVIESVVGIPVKLKKIRK